MIRTFPRTVPDAPRKEPARRKQPRNAVFVLATPLTIDGEITVDLRMKHGGWNSDDLQTMNPGRFRISYTTDENPVADPLPAKVRKTLAVVPDRRTPAQ